LPHGTPPPLISIVAPVFNEAASLSELVRRIAETARILEDRYAFEILLVDDGSTDGSLEVAKGLVRGESRLRVIELRRNFGQTAALQAGLDAAHGDILISMDSDLQHFPEDIPLLVAKIEEGYDLVCGWRHDRREGIGRRWPSWAANLIIRRISRLSLQDFGTTFRAYRGDLIRHMRLLGEQHRFVPALAEMVGARIAEVKIRNIERPFGQSSYGLGRTIGVLLDITFLFFSVRYLNRPLRAFGKIAMLLSLVGIAIAVWLLGYSLLTGVATVREHSGWFMLAAILLLSSLQIMLVGILAEVLVRIYYRLGGSEAYVIRKEWRATETERVR
jgi:glycosyltransferase involved in cell wall biosynthesis